MKSRLLLVFSAVGMVLGSSGHLSAADHTDSPAAIADPASDVNDVFAWMTSDASQLNMIMTVSPFAGSTTQFSTAVQYAFHVNSMAGYGMPQTETPMLCQFYDSDRIECWLGDEYVEGDPSDPAGITSASGKVRVFAGLRDDPFYFESFGFNATVDAVIAAAPSLNFDADGCPALDAATSNALVTQLASGNGGSAAADRFADSNILAITVQVDKDLVTGGGPILGVWGSTHAGN